MDSSSSENIKSKWEINRKSCLITSTSADAPRLEIYVKKGINLVYRDNQDPFLIVWSHARSSATCDFSTSRKLKSKPAKSSANPEWREVFEISVSIDENNQTPLDTISIYIWDKDNCKIDDFLGCADIPLSNIIRDKENVMTLPLEGVESGQIEIVVYPHNFGKEDSSKIEISAYLNSALIQNLSGGAGGGGIGAPSIKNVSSFLNTKKDNKLNNRYTIIRNLEKGGFGIVFVVKDEKTGEEKALKKIMCKTLEDANRAIKEAWPFKSLIHENLVLYEDMFLDVEQHLGGEFTFFVCYIMPYYKQGDLHALLEGKQRSKPKKYLKPVVLANWIVQIAKGIEYLHNYRVVHRDLKHKNIFFTEGYKQLKIGDFGFAKQVEEGRAYTQLGSSGYIAPEIQTSSSGYGLGVDIWSFAVMVYEMITLRIGREQISHAILAQYNFDDYWRINIEAEVKKAYTDPQVHTLLINFLSKILRIDPSERATATECVKMARELRQIFAEKDK